MSAAADIISAVKGQRDQAADNLHRAAAAFRCYSPSQMEEQHGESGRSRAERISAIPYVTPSLR